MDGIAEIEKEAAEARELVSFARRAFTVELAGTPKAGKSTSVNVLSNFFKRNGFRVHIIHERASLCPIPMKGHLFFNTWTFSTMLAGLLEHVETDVDILIADRGIFDSLVWLQLQQMRGEVLESEANIISQFLLLPRWTKITDVVLALKTSPEKAMERELAPLITSRPGSVMNPSYLSAYNAAYDVAIERYRQCFRAFHVIDTSSSGDPRTANIQVAATLLDEMKRELNPPVLVLPRDLAATFPLEPDGGRFDATALGLVMETIRREGQLVPRAEGERRGDLVQVIPAGVLLYDGRPFVFERREKDPKYKLYGKVALWKGCHAHMAGSGASVDSLGEALLQRIADELFLSRRFPLRAVGYTWDQNDPGSSRHLGIVYTVTVDSEDAANGIHSKEFRKARGHALHGRFCTRDEVNAILQEGSMEPWSVAICRYLWGRN